MTRRNTLSLTAMALLCSAVALAQPGLAQSSSPLIGTWKVNLAKSTYSPGPPPRSNTITFEAIEGGLRGTQETVNAQGVVSKQVDMTFDDGKFHPLAGVPAFDAQASRQVNDSTRWEIRMKAGKVVQTLMLEVSADGKTETVTVAGVTGNGQQLYNVIVRDKQ
jgi:hypothetical protein